MPSGPQINGGGISLSDAGEETDEEGGETEFVSTSEQITQEADPESFDRTFLAQAEDWKLGGPFSSPAPFPLQVVPRMAYVINYSYVLNEDRDRWEPQKKSNLARGTIAASGQETLASGSSGTISTGFTDQDLDGDTLVPSMGLQDGEFTDATVFAWTDPGDSTVDVAFAIGWSPTRREWFIEWKNNSADTVGVNWAVQRINTF